MSASRLLIAALLICRFCSLSSAQTTAPAYWAWASTPPMGWNSWDCFGAGVNEEQTRANADYMADKLKQHGWEYIIVDIQWYEPQAHTDRYRRGAVLTMDESGRLMPAPNRFPSAADGRGFKSLADYIHSRGLKFGVHLMRGIPRQAVTQDTPILGTNFRASQIADKTNICRWNTDMFGVDMTKPGAQEYYDSVFALIAGWDVDYVKVDDLSAPNYHEPEVAAIRKAIDKTGRPMVLSTSPGATPLDQADHVSTHANLWRISDDFWDNWKSLKEQFARCNNWSKSTAPGHWPDADMLPFGAIRQWRDNEWTHFTKDEQRTVMTLWSLFRSPLMIGADLPKNDEFTLSLLTNDEVIAVDQKSTNGHQLSNRDDLVIWIADVPGSADKYIGLFNAKDAPAGGVAEGLPVAVDLTEVGMPGPCIIRDLWAHKTVAYEGNVFAPKIPFHGAGLYRLTPGTTAAN